jgi:hypothetical protein
MAEIRKKQLDGDFRKDPKTDLFCCRCQKDIKPNSGRKWVHLIDGGASILHPDDEKLYTPDGGDLGLYPIGMECARIIGKEWSR